MVVLEGDTRVARVARVIISTGKRLLRDDEVEGDPCKRSIPGGHYYRTIHSLKNDYYIELMKLMSILLVKSYSGEQR
jgi:hypothetical protein